MKKKIIILVAAVLIIITAISPYGTVIPDMIKVGLNYISLKRAEDTVTKEEITELLESSNFSHPFVLACKSDFEKVRNEYQSKSFTEYTRALSESVLDNANGLLNTEIYPPTDYVLDEEDSILPISRETINRIIILGYAYKITGDVKYADRAWLELDNVCGYKDWCTSHFLATAEMSLAVAIGYDWLFDYLDSEQKSLLAEKFFSYALKPALSKNYLKNWFTWSKNNWNSICYSGIGISCMAFSEYYPEESARFLEMCYKNMPIAFENFTPDGVYAEGPGYSQSGTNAIVNFIATSQNRFGTDFGMSEIDGFRQLGYFPAYISTPTGVFNFGDNKARMCFGPVLHWYADKYESPLLSAYQMQDVPGEFVPDTSDSTEKNSSGKEDALSLLWYNRAYTATDNSFDKEPLSVHLKSDVGQELVLMRSEYLNPDATFAGIKAGYNFINHGDLDIGSFVFDSMGERWAEELGPGSYDAPGYFVNTPAGGRWKNYCKRAEGQNTLVINPDLTLDDQYVLADCAFDKFKSNDNGGCCSLNMTDCYRMNGAKNTVREFELYNNKSCLKITDTIDCYFPSDIYWFMHTKAEINISDDGKSAVLTLNGKQLKATLINDGEFSVMPAKALSGGYEYDEEYSDINKLTVHISGKKSAVITVTLEPK